MFVGACQSEHAAKVWKKLGPLPGNLLVAFSGKEKIEVIREVLGTFLQQGDLCLPGEIEISKPIEFLERDIEELAEALREQQDLLQVGRSGAANHNP